jgi:glucose/arabinose dehydrogenase
MTPVRTTLLAVALVGVLIAVALGAEVIGHNVRSERREATDERIRQLQAPPGFTIDVLARDLGNPRMMVVGDDGTVYVSRPDTDDVIALSVRDGRVDGAPRVVLSQLDGAHGLTLTRGRLYVAGVRKVVAADADDTNGVIYRVAYSAPR